MTYDDLLALLRRRRMEMGISQAELARRLGVSSAGMSQRENGQREPRSFDELQQWLAELGLTLTAVADRDQAVIAKLRDMAPGERAAVESMIEVIAAKK